MSRRSAQIDYEPALRVAISAQDLPGYKKVGVWKGIRFVLYSPLLAGGFPVAYALAGMK